MPSNEYARLRDLWNKYQSGYPGIDATKIRDVTSMDGVTVYDSQGRPSTSSSFEDNLRRPWQNTSAWAEYGVKKGFVKPADVYAASVELWETGVLFQEPGKIRDFTGLSAPAPEVVQAQNQNQEPVPVISAGGPMTGGNTGIAGGIGLPNTTVPSGGIILSGEITRSSLPTRELSERVAGAGTYAPASETYAAQFGAPGAAGMGGMPTWMWIAIAAVAVYLLARES
jgi:hypothetical protein